MDQVKALSIRHIKYGVKPEFFKGFSTVVTNVLRCLLNDDFTAETQAAWAYAWDGVSRCLAGCLSMGTNLITIALVTVHKISKSLLF